MQDQMAKESIMVSATAQVVAAIGSPFQRQIVELDELRANEVLVNVKACGICHTDIAAQQGKLPVPLPAILGHEGSVSLSPRTNNDTNNSQQGQVLSRPWARKSKTFK